MSKSSVVEVLHPIYMNITILKILNVYVKLVNLL